MELRFKKFKTTNSLFYKKPDFASIKIENDHLTLMILPYLGLCEDFRLIGKIQQDFEKETFAAIPKDIEYDDLNDPDFSKAKAMGIDRYICIYKNYRKVIILDGNNVGIILKN